jgi:hypothetical protein
MVIDERFIEKIFTAGVKAGTMNTLRELGLLSERVTQSSAVKTYGRRKINEWRSKGWVTGYPSGNTQRGTVYFKRSELENASRMMDIHNAVPVNRIIKEILL